VPSLRDSCRVAGAALFRPTDLWLCGNAVRSPMCRGAADENSSFAPSGLGFRPLFHPRLAPWAVFFRRFAAAVRAGLRGCGQGLSRSIFAGNEHYGLLRRPPTSRKKSTGSQSEFFASLTSVCGLITDRIGGRNGR
jgi:hypothetical protein